MGSCEEARLCWDGGNDATSRDEVSGGHVLACRMGYYYRCRIPPLGDEDACIAFDALQIGLSSALAEMLQEVELLLSPRRDV